MKTLLLMFVFIVACTPKGYYVGHRTIYRPNAEKFTCEKSLGLFRNPLVLAYCDTQQECNELCARQGAPK